MTDPCNMDRDLWYAAVGVVCAIVGAGCLLLGTWIGAGKLWALLVSH